MACEMKKLKSFTHANLFLKDLLNIPIYFVIISQKVMRRFIQRLLKSRLVIA